MTAVATLLLLLVGSLVKGVIGLGLPMIAIPILTLLVGLPHALAIVALPAAVANAWQVWQFRDSRRGLGFVASFLVAGAVGIAAGTWLLVTLPEAALNAGLAAIVIVYLMLRLTHPALALPREIGRRLAPYIGLASGVLHGSTGISGPIGITYFHSMRLVRREFVFCTGAMFLLFSAAQLPMLRAAGLLTGNDVLLGIASLPCVALGLTLGNRIAGRVDHAVFDRLVLLVLAFTAGALLWRALPEMLALQI